MTQNKKRKKYKRVLMTTTFGALTPLIISFSATSTSKNIGADKEQPKSSSKVTKTIKKKLSSTSTTNTIYNYNQKYKIVATNDNHKKKNNFQDIYYDKNPNYVIVSKEREEQSQIDLLKNIDGATAQTFKIVVDKVKNEKAISNVPFTVESLQNQINNNFEDSIDIYVDLNSQIQNGDIVKSVDLKNSAGGVIKACFKWNKNQDKTWNLELIYEKQNFGALVGQQDSIYRYKATISSSKQRIKLYNNKYKIIATNDDNQSDEDVIYYNGLPNNILVVKKWDTLEQLDLLKNIPGGKLKIFKIIIDKVNDKFSIMNVVSKVPNLKVRIKKQNFEDWKTIYIDLKQSTLNGDIVKKFDIKDTAQGLINAQLKWFQNSDGTWNLKLFYVKKATSNSDNDSIYRYRVSELSAQQIEEKKQAELDIDAIKSTIVGIKATKNTNEEISSIPKTTKLDSIAWKKLVDAIPFFETKDTNLTYRHKGITNDGEIEVIIKITKEKTDKEEEARFKIVVSGIDKAKANNQIDKAISQGIFPGVVYNAKSKTAKVITKTDLVPPRVSGMLKFTIDKVTKSTTITDGTVVTATISVTSTVQGSKTTNNTYKVELPGFMSEVIYDANQEIDKAIQTKQKPAIKTNSQVKTANDVKITDLVVPANIGTLKFEVTNVAKSTITQDGSTVTATIKVASSVEGAKTTNNTYQVEVRGFINEAIIGANQEIDKAIQTKQKPAIKTNSQVKTANDVKITDLVVPANIGTLKFEVTNVAKSTITQDGSTVTATIKVASSVEGAKTTNNTYQVEVRGFINESIIGANQEIDKAIQTKQKPAIKTNSQVKTANDVKITDLVVPANIGTLKFEVTNVAKSTITQDGSTVTATIKVASSVEGAKTTNNTYQVEVEGFASEATIDINDVKKIIDRISNVVKITPFHIKAVNSPKPFNDKVFATLGVGLRFPTNIKGTILTYTHNGISSDGILEIEVQISKKGGISQNAKFDINVLGIDVAAEKRRIEALSKLIIQKSVFNVARNSLQEASLQLGKAKTSALAYKISHSEFSNDGDYDVHISINKTYTKETAMRRIQIKGIDSFRDQKTVADIQKLFDLLVKTANGTWSTLVAKSITLPSTLKSKTTANDIGFIDPTLNKRNGTDIAFKVKETNDSKGTLDVEVVIKKGLASTTFSFRLNGYQTIVQALNIAKNKAKEIIDNIELPKQDDSKHDTKSFNMIKVTKIAAKTAIDNAKTIEDIKSLVSSNSKGVEIQKMNDAIKTYKGSTNIKKISQINIIIISISSIVGISVVGVLVFALVRKYKK